MNMSTPTFSMSSADEAAKVAVEVQIVGGAKEEKTDKQEGDIEIGVGGGGEEEVGSEEDDLGSTPAKASANALKKQKKRERKLNETLKAKGKEEAKGSTASGSKRKQ